MRRLVLIARHLHAIERHAASTYPEECCGILLGRPLTERDGGTLVERVVPAHNEVAERRGDRYAVAPRDLAGAQRQARELGLAVVGYYHSHPDRPALPSEHDRLHAWPGFSYLILELENGVPGEMRSFRLTDDRAGFAEESVELPLAGPVRRVERLGTLARASFVVAAPVRP